MEESELEKKVLQAQNVARREILRDWGLLAVPTDYKWHDGDKIVLVLVDSKVYEVPYTNSITDLRRDIVELQRKT